MKRLFLLLSCVLWVAASCGSAKKKTTPTATKTNTTTTNGKHEYSVTVNPGNTQVSTVTPGKALKDNRPTKELLLVDNVINEALGYLGTRYKYGGTTRSGMDCSGLVYTSFLSQNVVLEHSSYQIAEFGSEISLKKVLPGDLLFFITGKGKRINHVGLVIESTTEEVKFIHSTTSRGVIISSMSEGYWSNSFKLAKRLSL